jgi:DNA repair photolyase
MRRLVSSTRPKITEKRCKTALSKSGLSYDYTVNPYTGCLHSCVYCYANFMRRFSGHMKDPWGSFVDVKVNLLEVLAGELPKRPGGSVWLSSVCDPYQQPEAKYELTRGAIQLISQYPKFTISILTKNALVLRDLDLLKRMGDRVDVGFTITTFSNEAQQIFEPHSSRVKERIGAMKRLNEAGLETWAFIAPMLPYVTEIELEDGLRQLKEAGVKRLLSDRYNARGSVINQTIAAYRAWNPKCDVKRIRQLLWGGDEYYRELDAKISRLWKEMTPDATYERDLDWYLNRKSGANTQAKWFCRSNLSRAASRTRFASISCRNSRVNPRGNPTFWSIRSMGRGRPVAGLWTVSMK